jgi:hypothetical protein
MTVHMGRADLVVHLEEATEDRVVESAIRTRKGTLQLDGAMALIASDS